MIRKETFAKYSGNGFKGLLYLSGGDTICCIDHPDEYEIEPIIEKYSFPWCNDDVVTVTPLPGKETEVRKWVALCNLMGCKDEIKILPDEGGEDAEE